jgi:hypothetical protein
MKLHKLIIAAASLFATSAFAEFNFEDLRKAEVIALDSFKVEYPDHLAHVSGFTTVKSGADAQVKVTISHHTTVENFVFTCLKLTDSIECQAEQN